MSFVKVTIAKIRFIDERAICSGLTGTAGFFPGESAEPVTAHEIMTLRCMLVRSLKRRACRSWSLPFLRHTPTTLSHRPAITIARGSAGQ